ncbi:MAG: FlgD immunoglobulin-like domain containing protein [Cyclobacteriaceae bacterium]
MKIRFLGSHLKLVAISLLLICTSTAPGHKASQADILSNPVLFTLVVPPLFSNGNFGHQLETFGNHLTGMDAAPRGGDLCLLMPDGTIRFLTQEAGFGVGSSEIQAENAIAVRQPNVHWDADKALFSMVIGGPTKAFDQSYRENKWQIYEITNLAEVINGMTPQIVHVENQPEYNNISPIYGSDGQIIFTSDAPLFELAHTYPQFDEYESAPTNSGIFKLNRETGETIHLTHSPSGDFDIQLAKDGRVISTRWEHLKRDQQASNHRAGNTQWQPVNYVDESVDAEIVNAPATVDGKPYADSDGTPYEIFPEAFVHIENGINVEPNRNPNEPLHDFNEFLPWEISENGERHQTMNHVGRHEFGGVYQNGAKIDDPNLIEGFGNHSSNQYRGTVGSDAGIFQIKEDPRPGFEGTFYGAWSREFGRFSSGRIFEFSLPIGANPQDMEITDWTHPDIDNAENDKGHFRNPLMTMDGTMLVSHATQTQLFNQNNPYTFRIAKMVKANSDATDTEHIPGAPLTGNGITREIIFWGDNTTPLSISVQLSETDVVEVVQRDAPTPRPTYQVEDVEMEVLNEEEINVDELRSWMIDNNLALIAIRNATERDEAERQQPFNLRVPGGVESIPADGKVYDISHFQIFQADMIRGYGLRNFIGRRPIATPMHNSEQSPALEFFNLFDSEGPQSSVKIGLDGSIAAFVPATRALTWQTVSPDGESVVRERQWLTFSPGEIRTCEGCHGINEKTHLGNEKPTNKPEALRVLLQEWKNKINGYALGIDDVADQQLRSFPNPFFSQTSIRFTLDKEEEVTLTILSVDGRVIKKLTSGIKPKGIHEISWDGTTDAGSKSDPGIYLITLSTPSKTNHSRVILK